MRARAGPRTESNRKIDTTRPIHHPCRPGSGSGSGPGSEILIVEHRRQAFAGLLRGSGWRRGGSGSGCRGGRAVGGRNGREEGQAGEDQAEEAAAET